mgnify:CR=1 FL=1|jgi:hypothetical protein
MYVYKSILILFVMLSGGCISLDQTSTTNEPIVIQKSGTLKQQFPKVDYVQ